MSREALASYEHERRNQLTRNEARHIRTRVNEARQAPHLASVRWPFELLQNALDAGPRDGKSHVRVALRTADDATVFEHDGAPFTSAELAALLSGGSSKDFGSEETTGRFGTGFLVTHVLAERTVLEGILRLGDEFESFRLELDRGGDEEDILANIESCNAAIERAQPLPKTNDVPSARFEYQVGDDDTLASGVHAFRSSLPYLFGTCQALGEVTLAVGSTTNEVWTPGENTLTRIVGGVLQVRTIRMESDGRETRYRVLRFALDPESRAAVLLLLQEVEGTWEVVLPPPLAPRIYRQYPLRASGFLPIEFILDGRFEPDQERSRVLMTDGDKLALVDAFQAATLAVVHAAHEKLENGHLLARVALPPVAFDGNESERTWWQLELRTFAERLAHLPLVSTAEGKLPANSVDDNSADIIAPRLLDAAGPDETTVGRMWPLVDEASELYPPIADIAEDWSTIAADWVALGVDLDLVTAQVLAAAARGSAHLATELLVDRWLRGRPMPWRLPPLACQRALDVVCTAGCRSTVSAWFRGRPARSPRPGSPHGRD